MPQQIIAFDPNPPSLDAQISRPVLKLCTWVEDTTANGMPKVKLPLAIRSKWISDPVRNPQWHESIASWDHALQDKIAQNGQGETSIVPIADDSSAGAIGDGCRRGGGGAAVDSEDWTGEPTSVDDLNRKYSTMYTAAIDCGKGTCFSQLTPRCSCAVVIHHLNTAA